MSKSHVTFSYHIIALKFLQKFEPQLRSENNFEDISLSLQCILNLYIYFEGVVNEVARNSDAKIKQELNLIIKKYRSKGEYDSQKSYSPIDFIPALFPTIKENRKYSNWVETLKIHKELRNIIAHGGISQASSEISFMESTDSSSTKYLDKKSQKVFCFLKKRQLLSKEVGYPLILHPDYFAHKKAYLHFKENLKEIITELNSAPMKSSATLPLLHLALHDENFLKIKAIY